MTISVPTGSEPSSASWFTAGGQGGGAADVSSGCEIKASNKRHFLNIERGMDCTWRSSTGVFLKWTNVLHFELKSRRQPKPIWQRIASSRRRAALGWRRARISRRAIAVPNRGEIELTHRAVHDTLHRVRGQVCRQSLQREGLLLWRRPIVNKSVLHVHCVSNSSCYHVPHARASRG